MHLSGDELYKYYRYLDRNFQFRVYTACFKCKEIEIAGVQGVLSWSNQMRSLLSLSIG
jgi:hypothetical protein